MTTLATFSVWQDGQLVDRRYMTDEDEPEEVARIAEVQIAVCNLIDVAGGKYLVDIEFWDGEHVRWGTDRNGMVIPIEVGIEGLADGIERMREQRGTA